MCTATTYLVRTAVYTRVSINPWADSNIFTLGVSGQRLNRNTIDTARTLLLIISFIFLSSALTSRVHLYAWYVRHHTLTLCTGTAVVIVVVVLRTNRSPDQIIPTSRNESYLPFSLFLVSSTVLSHSVSRRCRPPATSSCYDCFFLLGHPSSQQQ